MKRVVNRVALACYEMSGVMYAFGMWAAFSEGYYFFSGVMLAAVLWMGYEHDKESRVEKK